MDRNYFDVIRKARAEGEPCAKYKKAIVGAVCVSVIDSFTGNPVQLILQGDPRDSKLDPEDITVFLWTVMEVDYFRRANKVLLKRGYMVPTSQDIVDEVSVNEISDEELETVLSEPFFSLKAVLDKITSPVPAMRLLRMAEDLNKPMGTVNAITVRLSELQRTDSPEELHED